MTKKRFSAVHLLLAMALTLGMTVGGGLLALRMTVGEGALSLLEGLLLVNTRFVGEYEPVQAVDAALEGMVKGLGDRWSYYLTAEEYEAQELQRKNQYVGIGVTVTYEREEGLLLNEILPGSPAEDAGLLVGEVILSADGNALSGDARYQGAGYIRGEAGTTVILEILGQAGTVRTVEVRRAAVDSDPVDLQMLDEKTGYVRVENFYANSAQRFQQAVEELQAQGAQGLVIDMRGNGGGYLTELTAMLDFLLPEGPIFISRNRAGRETVTQSDAGCAELPMVVLVDENTYSAAEFFAAELQEQGAAAVVGMPTSGKGYSQQSFRLPHGGAMNISTAAYFTGSGVSLIGTGLTLDAQVEPGDEGDAQLDKALELLGQRQEAD